MSSTFKLSNFLARKFFKNWGNTHVPKTSLFFQLYQLFWTKNNQLYQVYIPIPCDNAIAITWTEAVFFMFTKQVTICGYTLKTDMVSTWLKLYLKPCLSSRKQVLLFITPGRFCDVTPDSIQQESKTLVCLNAVITVFLTEDDPDERSCYRHQSKYRQAPCDCVADVNLLFKPCSPCDLQRRNKWSEEEGDSKILPI